MRRNEGNMRNMAMMVISMILGMLTLAMAFSISQRANCATEVHSNLSTAGEQTLRQLTKENGALTEEELLAYFVQQLVVSMDAEADLKVDIAGLDIQKGLLSTRISQIFAYPNGKEGRVCHDRTVILEQAP